MPERLALIGAGMIGKRHFRAIAQTDAIELAAIADVNADAAASPEQYGAPYFECAAEMVRSVQPAGAIAATPIEFHLEPACVILDAGCHMQIEQPITAAGAEADQITKLAAHTGQGWRCLVGQRKGRQSSAGLRKSGRRRVCASLRAKCLGCIYHV